jgi:hypothetical protein
LGLIHDDQRCLRRPSLERGSSYRHVLHSYSKRGLLPLSTQLVMKFLETTTICVTLLLR